MDWLRNWDVRDKHDLCGDNRSNGLAKAGPFGKKIYFFEKANNLEFSCKTDKTVIPSSTFPIAQLSNIWSLPVCQIFEIRIYLSRK